MKVLKESEFLRYLDLREELYVNAIKLYKEGFDANADLPFDYEREMQQCTHARELEES
jgi:hypothetical protein